MISTVQVAAAAERITGCAVPEGEPLMQAGLDSLGAVDLRRDLAAVLQLGALCASCSYLFPGLPLLHQSH